MRQFHRRCWSGITCSNSAKRRKFHPVFEVLEDRTVPASIHWNVDTDGFWDDPNNWDLLRVPNGGDDVVIDRSATNPTITVRGTDERAGTLTLTEKLVVAPGANLRSSESGPSTVAGTVVLNGGWYPNQGLRFTGDLSWNGTGGFASGTVTFAGTTHLTGAADHGAYNMTFINEGSFLHEGTGSLVTNNFNFNFINKPGAIYDFQSDADINGVHFINESGTVRKSGGSGTSFIGGQDIYTNRGDFVLNGGTIEATSGKLALRTYNPTGGFFNVGAGAVIDLLDGNNTTFYGTYTGSGLGRVELSNGTLQIDNNSPPIFNFDAGTFHWTAGAVANGRLINQGFIQVSGDADKAVYGGGGFINYGHVIQSGLGNINQYSGGGGRFENKVSGIYDIEGDSDIGGYFYNEGLFRKISGTGESKTSTPDQYGNKGAFIHQGGIVEVRSGTLSLGGGNESTGGTLKPSAGAAIELNGGIDTTLNGTYYLVGDGKVVHISAYIFPGTNFIIDATQGHFVWNSGTIYGNSFITRGDVELAGPDGKAMLSYWNIQGTVRQTGGSLFGARSTVDINQGGIYDMQGDFSLENIVGSGQLYVLNRGIFRKSSGVGEAVLNNDYTDTNNGTFEVLSGILSMPRNGTFKGVNFNVAAGTLINVNDRIYNAGKNYSGLVQGHGLGHVLFQATLQTPGSDTATFKFDQGVATIGRDTYFGGTFVIQGQLTFDSPTYIQWRGDFTNQGTMDMVGPSGLSFYTGGTAFDNQGIINLLGDNNLTANSGYGYPVVFTNSGSIRKIGGTGTSSISSEGTSGPFQLTNTGTIEVLTGTLSVASPTFYLPQIVSGKLTGGTWKAGPGATLTLPNAEAISNNQGNILLTGPGANFTNISGLTRNEGTLRLDQGKSFLTTGNFTNIGRLEAGANATFQVNGTLTLTGTSVIHIDITNSFASGSFGKVKITGATTLAGSLEINLQGYGPTSSEQYPAMSYASKTGSLAAITGLDPYLTVAVNPTAIVLNGQGTPPDLDVISVTTPANGIVGNNVTINYVVKNLSNTSVNGTWKDAVYLSRDRILSPDDKVLSLADRAGIVDANGTYQSSLTALVPNLIDGNYYVIVVADANHNVADSDRNNNIESGATAIVVQISKFGIGLPATGTLSLNNPVYYQLVVPSDRPDLLLNLNVATGSTVELFAAQGRLPTTADFDVASAEFNSNIATTLISNPGLITWYVMAIARTGSASNFTMNAVLASPELNGVSPTKIGNTGKVSLALIGNQLRASDLYQIVAPNGTTFTASQVVAADSRQVNATFNLNNAPMGQYAVQLVRNGQVIILSDKITVEATRITNPVPSLVMPGSYRAGLIFQGAVVYRNDGNVDIPAPVIILTGNANTKVALERQDLVGVNAHSVSNERVLLGVSKSSNPAVLHPGEEARIPFWALESTGSGASINVDYQTVDSNDPIDWLAVSSEMRPEGLTDARWNSSFSLFQAAVGSTWGQYVQFLNSYVQKSKYQPEQLPPEASYLLPNGPGMGSSKYYETLAILDYAFRELRAEAGKEVGGTIFLGDSSHPLAGAIVRLSNETNGVTAITDANGVYRLPQLPNGTYSLAVDGYLTTSPVSLTLSGSILNNQNVVVQIGGVVEGLIRRSTDAALLSGLRVIAQGTSGSLFTAYTDSNGHYRFTGLPTDNYTLSTSTVGLAATNSTSFTVLSSDHLREVNLMLSLASRVTGMVTINGNPVVGIHVSLSDSAGKIWGVSTNAQGQYAFENLSAGSYTVTAIKSGFVTNDQSVIVASASDVQVPTLALAAGADLSLVVKNHLSSFIQNAQVALIRNNTLAGYATTSSTGQLTIPELAAGTYDLIINAHDYQTYRTQVALTAGATLNQTIVLENAILLQGTVTTSLGTSISNMMINIFSEDNDGVIHSFNAQTDENGFYSIRLPEGNYAIAVGNHAGIRRRNVTLSTNRPLEVVDITLPGASLQGRVLAADGVMPQADAVVELRQNGALLATATTNQDGNYFFRSLIAGQYDLAAENVSGVTSSLVATVTADQLNTAPLLFTGSLSLQGVIFSDNFAPIGGAIVSVVPLSLAFTSQVTSQMTDIQGHYHFDGLVPGSYELKVVANGWATGKQQIVVNQDTVQNATLTQGYSVSGHLQSTGQAVGNALVTVLDPITLQAVGITSTDVAGNYILSHIPAGNYHLLISSFDYQVHLTQNVVVAANTSIADVDLIAKTTQLSGVIVDDNNQPITLAQVEILDSTGIPLAYTTTNLHGQYSMDQLAAGIWTIHVSLPGYRPCISSPITLQAGIPVTQNLQLTTVGTDDIQLSDNFTDVAIYMTNYFTGLLMPPVNQWIKDKLASAGEPQRYAGDSGHLDLAIPGSDACSEKEALYLRALDGYDRKEDAYSNWNNTYAGFEKTLNASAAAFVFQATDTLGTAYLTLRFRAAWTAYLNATYPQLATLVVAQMTQFFLALEHAMNGPGGISEGISFDNIKNTITKLVNVKDSFGSLKDLVNPIIAAIRGSAITRFSFNPIGLILKLDDIINTTYDSLKAMESVSNSVGDARNLYVQRAREYFALKRAYDEFNCDDPNNTKPKPPQHGPHTSIGVWRSLDPNQLQSTGVGGFGAVRPGEVISYTANFENLPTATAAAQIVKVTLPLSSNLEWSSLQLTGIGFNDVNLTIPGGLHNYETVVTSSSDPSHPVKVSISFNPATGILTATMQSIDPQTGEDTSDPVAGFLPPDDTTGRGRGYLIFDIQAKGNLAAGTEIRNQASIIFDANAPLLTNESLNTIDREAPVTKVNSLPPTTSNTSFLVTWGGTDPNHGAGIVSYDIYVSINNGAYSPWKKGTSDISGLFTGENGKKYSFYSLAHDGLGMDEAAHSTADVTIEVLTNLKPTIEKIVLANGNVQRSKFYYVQVYFNILVTIDKSAFELYINGKRFTVASITTNIADSKTVATLQFQTSQLSNLSLPEGQYRLVTRAKNVKAKTGGLAMESDRTDTFFRLFGDVNGDGKVDATDLAVFNTAYNKKSGQAGYLAYLDYDNNGRIDAKDLAAFNSRLKAKK